ncbi:GNAT family N-acetyltransferase [Scatolibacter rhodanostii]|uniref:GNAT family N-acetyltransferase n=1 Tax=Scatolibacter rhodanostii TaxID=2014781 RepID=UPI000C06D680|nr:GNAT family N-acetyltransferase [Scatolibacter rhodanostii]
MHTITYSKLTRENFNLYSLDNFIRYQITKESWRKVDSQLVLVPNDYIEDWDLNKRRYVAKKILDVIDQNGIAYGAFNQGDIIGDICLGSTRFGSHNQYIELAMFHVSEPFRKQGVGRTLFKLACDDIKNLGVAKLYLSANSAKESILAYRKLGCVEALEINHEIAQNEPFDIQMEYKLY